MVPGHQLRHEQASCDSRRHLLQEMQDAHEGLTDAVKHVLDNLDDFPGVRGLLADFLDTDRAHAPIVEAALGPNLPSQVHGAGSRRGGSLPGYSIRIGDARRIGK